jgi:hypothetical protein
MPAIVTPVFRRMPRFGCSFYRLGPPGRSGAARFHRCRRGAVALALAGANCYRNGGDVIPKVRTSAMRRSLALMLLLSIAMAAAQPSVAAAQTPAVGAPTPWPLKTPAELKKLHGPTFVGMQILTYRREQQPAVEGAAPEVTIGIGRSFLVFLACGAAAIAA